MWNVFSPVVWSSVTFDNSVVFLQDKTIQNFIASTYDDVSSTDSASLLGDRCLPEDIVYIPEEEPEEYMTPEEYIESIDVFINNASIDSVINDILTKKAQEELQNAPWLPEPWTLWWTPESWNPSYASAVGNFYAEKAFGDIAAVGTCEYGCNGLPFVEQGKCQLDCAKKCVVSCHESEKQWKLFCEQTYEQTLLECNEMKPFKKAACKVDAFSQKKICTTNSVSTEAICISDCTCFMMAWPIGPWREKIENMFRIKFCKIPVQSKVATKKTKVFSIQALFQEISDVLQWLKDSGQMVKFTETKEFLDGVITTKLADNFDFKLQVSFKPVFEPRKPMVEQKKWEEHNSNLGLGILNMNTANLDADNYNKYIVVADVEKNKASSEPIHTLSDIPKNVAALKKVSDTVREENVVSLQDFKSVTSSYVQQTNIFFVQNMMEFLEDNRLFWDNVTNDLLDMTRMSLELQSKIEHSK